MSSCADLTFRLVDKDQQAQNCHIKLERRVLAVPVFGLSEQKTLAADHHKTDETNLEPTVASAMALLLGVLKNLRRCYRACYSRQRRIHCLFTERRGSDQ
jgi:hypothetical protein